MKYKCIFSVKIKLPKYVTRIEPQDVKHSTRNKVTVLKGTDKIQFKCNMLPKINTFKNNYFVRTLNHWNELPLSLREEEFFEKNFFSLKRTPMAHPWI